MPGSPDWQDFNGAPAQMQKAHPGRDLSQALPEDLFVPAGICEQHGSRWLDVKALPRSTHRPGLISAESAVVDPAYQEQEFRRGQSVWYRQRDGTWAPAEVGRALWASFCWRPCAQ